MVTSRPWITSTASRQWPSDSLQGTTEGSYGGLGLGSGFYPVTILASLCLPWQKSVIKLSQSGPVLLTVSSDTETLHIAGLFKQEGKQLKIASGSP